MAAPLRATVQSDDQALAVELPRSLGPAWRQGAELGLVVHGADALLLFREGSGPPGYLAGDLPGLPLEELFGLILSGMRSGKLILTREGARKTVSFIDGQVVFATSTEPYERLGRSMVRRGILSEEQLGEALSRVRPGFRLGQVLTSAGLSSQATLYAQMGELIKEIVLGLFELEEGHWLFLEGVAATDDAVKLRERTQEVLLQGMRRAEAVAKLRRKLPPMRRLILGQRPAGEEAELSGLLTLAERGVEVVALRAEFEGSEHAFLTALENLLSSGALVDEEESRGAEPAPIPEASGKTLFQRYQALTRRLGEELQGAGGNLDDLRAFFLDPLPGLDRAFAGVRIRDDGSLELARVLENVGRREKDACEAVESFLSYALFFAKNILPPEKVEELGTELRQLQKQQG